MNLKALESRFLRICCRRFGSLSMNRGRSVGELHVEWQILGFGHVAEVALDGVAQGGEGDFLGLDGDGAGLDLREIEDVVDEVEQIGAGGVDVPGELDLLVGEVARGVSGELLAEDEDGIERRAQLVRHVRQELGLVLRGERQLRGLFLERAAGLLDFLFLRSTSAFCSASCLAFVPSSSLVCCSSLWRDLQFDGELLRLREQVLGAHRRFDRVEHDADALGQLIEEARWRR